MLKYKMINENIETAIKTPNVFLKSLEVKYLPMKKELIAVNIITNRPVKNQPLPTEVGSLVLRL